MIAMRTVTSNIESLAKLTQFYVNIDSLLFSVQRILNFGMHVEFRDGWPHQNGDIFGLVPREEGRGVVIFNPKIYVADFLHLNKDRLHLFRKFIRFGDIIRPLIFLLLLA